MSEKAVSQVADVSEGPCLRSPVCQKAALKITPDSAPPISGPTTGIHA